MTAIVPFDFSNAPATRPQRRDSSVNREALTGGGPSFGVYSIKGKVFALSENNERKVITRIVDGEEEPAPFMNLIVVRANPKARTFFAKQYVEGDDAGTKPTCFSHDGVRPDATVDEPQSASCGTCPHAVWGSKNTPDGKGTACAVRTRLAVIDPRAPTSPRLLSVPAGSRSNFNEAVKLVDNHGKDYNEAVMRIGFDQEAPSPKLTFKPVGMVADELYNAVQELFDSDTVKEIIGTPSVPMAQEVSRPAIAHQPKPVAEQVRQLANDAAAKAKAAVVSEDEVEAALNGTAPAPAPAPARKTTARKTAAPAAAPAAQSTSVSSLVDDLNSLLDASDD